MKTTPLSKLIALLVSSLCVFPTWAQEHQVPAAPSELTAPAPETPPAEPQQNRLEGNEAILTKLKSILTKGVPEKKTIQVVNTHTPDSENATALAPTTKKRSRKTVKAAIVHEDMHWSYTGETSAEHWAALNPSNALCGEGQYQSPIDINTQQAIPLQLEPLAFSYGPLTGEEVNNGHTIQVNINGTHTVKIRGKTYGLVQFHFHHPAEEKVNGKGFPMVMHLVHKNSEGQLAVVALFIEVGNENEVLNQVWSRLPFREGDKNPISIPNTALDALLPQDQSYYTYTGSLTTPPCSENVLWVVLKHPITMSLEQVSTFAKLYPYNARPTQESHARLIQQSR